MHLQGSFYIISCTEENILRQSKDSNINYKDPFLSFSYIEVNIQRQPKDYHILAISDGLLSSLSFQFVFSSYLTNFFTQIRHDDSW